MQRLLANKISNKLISQPFWHLIQRNYSKNKKVEGAATRNCLQSTHPDYFNEELLEDEMRRVFDICHSCRACFNLCDAFPTLFDLIDQSKTCELESVPTPEFSVHFF